MNYISLFGDADNPLPESRPMLREYNKILALLGYWYKDVPVWLPNYESHRFKKHQWCIVNFSGVNLYVNYNIYGNAKYVYECANAKYVLTKFTFTMRYYLHVAK